MKTYFKDYSLANSVLTHHEDRISDVMNERQKKDPASFARSSR